MEKNCDAIDIKIIMTEKQRENIIKKLEEMSKEHAIESVTVSHRNIINAFNGNP
jgi:hypothetical protein